MAATVRFDLNFEGMRSAALTSPEVRAMILAKGEAVAVAARSTTKWTIDVNGGGKDRARVYVSYAGGHDEAETRVLGRALDAAR